MKPERFLDLLNKPQLLDEESLTELGELLMHYPYFQSARVLWNYNLHCLQLPDSAKQLRTTAVYAGDRRKLFELFSKPLNKPIKAEKTELTTKTVAPANETTKAEHKDAAPDITAASTIEEPKKDTQPESAVVVEKKAVNERKESLRTAKEKRGLDYMKVYFAADIDNVVNYFRQKEYQHTVITQMSVQPQSATTDATEGSMSTDELESFIQSEANRLKADTAADIRERFDSEARTDVETEEAEATEGGIVDHDTIIDTLISNLRRAREKAIEEDDEDEIDRLLGGRPKLKSKQEDYNEVLKKANADEKPTTEASTETIAHEEPLDQSFVNEILELDTAPSAEAEKAEAPAEVEKAEPALPGTSSIDLFEIDDETAQSNHTLEPQTIEDDNKASLLDMVVSAMHEMKENQLAQKPETDDDTQENKNNETDNEPVSDKIPYDETTKVETESAESTEVTMTETTTVPRTEESKAEISANETPAERAMRKVAEIRARREKEKEQANDNSQSEEEKKNPDQPESNAQINLIDKFIETAPRIARKAPDNTEQVDIAKDSVKENNDLVSEGLAKLYVAQKHYDKALDMYQKLSLKFPEKSTYFADRIAEVKKSMNQK